MPERPMPDAVFLEDARFQARIGLTATERARYQTLRVDLSWTASVAGAGDHDDLDRLIDYAAVWDTAAAVIAAGEHKLIEALAERLAAALLAAYPMDSIRVCIRKPGALGARGVGAAGVALTRGREA